MKPRVGKIAFHLVLLGGLTALLVLFMAYPFLPGGYDRLAVGLSLMAQLAGVVGLRLVPVGLLWLSYELRKRPRAKPNQPKKARGATLALAAMIVATICVLAISVGASATVGLSLGFGILGLQVYVLWRVVPRLKRLKEAEGEDFNPAALYLTFFPIVALFWQLVPVAPLTEFSKQKTLDRNRGHFVTGVPLWSRREQRY